MLHWLVDQLGLWSWWITGLALLALEMALPGMFLIWFGVGALLTGLLSVLFWGDAFWPWQVQFIVFASFSVISILLGRKLVRSDAARSDEPLLNQRTASLVGRTATLEDAIVEGRGRIRLDGTFWPVIGPDLAAGTRIKIVSAHGNDLTVDVA
ncbi:membrane protein implicated in regulation of membrane protease activity [Agrobacterium vitis]|nr:membrane protein implicated in regulation of membrane protease activity [Agrobacterium vitis]MBE1436834.1 membrane protein implicated in regulation of membrane protease activity [Agrobacterium vitis]